MLRTKLRGKIYLVKNHNYDKRIEIYNVRDNFKPKNCQKTTCLVDDEEG